MEVGTAHKEAHVAAKAAYARSSSQGGVQRRATFLLLDDVSAGLSTRRTDPRRRRARITFAAGLDWEGTKRASARFVLMRNFVRPGYSFLKRKRGEICIGARLPFPVEMSSTSRPGFGLLLRETRQHRQPEHIMQRYSGNCASLCSRRCLPHLATFYSQTTDSLSVISAP